MPLLLFYFFLARAVSTTTTAAFDSKTTFACYYRKTHAQKHTNFRNAYTSTYTFVRVCGVYRAFVVCAEVKIPQWRAVRYGVWGQAPRLCRGPRVTSPPLPYSKHTHVLSRALGGFPLFVCELGVTASPPPLLPR